MATALKTADFDGTSTTANTTETLFAPTNGSVNTAIGLLVANTVALDIRVTVKIVRSGGTTVYLGYEVPIDPGSSLEFLSGNKHVILDGDTLTVESDTDNSWTATMSYAEQT